MPLIIKILHVNRPQIVIGIFEEPEMPLIFAGKDRREVQQGRGGDAGSGPSGIVPDSMNLRRGLSVDHIVKFQYMDEPACRWMHR